MISDFCSIVNEIFILLGHYAAWMVVSHPHFMTTCWSHLQGSSSQRNICRI